MLMHCNQCEQTTKGSCCVKIGICGKSPALAESQDKLVAACIATARCVEPCSDKASVLEKALFATLTNVDFDCRSIDALAQQVTALAATAEPFAMRAVWTADEDVRSLKSLILYGLKGLAAYSYHARILGRSNPEVDAFYFEALRAISEENALDKLLEVVMKTGKVNLSVMEMLDEANTSTYGHPEPTTVTTTIAPGPFIVVTGHDLHDLALLLEATKDK